MLDQLAARGGCLLRDGSRLHRLRAPGALAPGRQLLRHPRQVQPQGPAPLLRIRSTEPRAWSAIRRSCSRASTPARASRRRCDASSSTIPRRARRLVFLTNNFALPALTIAQLYRCRWQVELFFKWIKQHLRIKAFFGTTRERREDANLDRGLRLRARGHRQEAAQPLGEPVRNPTDPEPDHVRANPTGSTAYLVSRRSTIIVTSVNQLNLFE